MKRLPALVLAVAMLFSLQTVGFACNENQTNTYITQILFGDSALSKSDDDNVKLLLNAVYLCCEQADNQGQDKLAYLKSQRVSGASSLASLNISGDILLECSHNSWDHEVEAVKRNQANRKQLLRSTVNQVFDFGLFNNLFVRSGGKCDSFSAFLFYLHILSDYLADDPSETETTVNGKHVISYSGQASVTLHGNQPSFTTQQKKQTDSFSKFSTLDGVGRAGVAFAIVGPEIMPPSNSRQNIGMIKPSGWNQNRYPGIVNSDPPYLYNRCHLIAHQLVGNDEEENLITGTRYLNETGMKPYEDKVAAYVRETGNHVLYRATPIYKGYNRIASGVQIEAYSVEDFGKGICFNVYCYNVQPGVQLNYVNGENETADFLFDAQGVLPFAIANASASNPDLIFEMNKHLDVLFENQRTSSTYTTMKNEINSIADEARAIGNRGESDAQCYAALKKCEYDYLEVLISYVPQLLQKESFFTSAFK